MQKKLSDAIRLNAIIGMGFIRSLRNHFKVLNRRPNKRGWRSIGFWAKITKSVSFVGANATRATVTVQGAEGHQFAEKAMFRRKSI